MKIIGNLTERNCTSLLNNVTMLNDAQSYYFRIEDPSFIATDTANACKINVHGKRMLNRLSSQFCIVCMKDGKQLASF